MKTEPLSVPSAIFWAAAYLGVMLVYTGLDVANPHTSADRVCTILKCRTANISDETSSAPAAPQEPRSPSSSGADGR